MDNLFKYFYKDINVSLSEIDDNELNSAIDILLDKREIDNEREKYKKEIDNEREKYKKEILNIIRYSFRDEKISFIEEIKGYHGIQKIYYKNKPLPGYLFQTINELYTEIFNKKDYTLSTLQDILPSILKNIETKLHKYSVSNQLNLYKDTFFAGFKNALLIYFIDIAFKKLNSDYLNDELKPKDFYIKRDYYLLYDVLCVLEIIYNERKKNKKGGKRKSRRKSRNNRRKTNVRRRSRT